MPGPFATAVTQSIRTEAGNWECNYYRGSDTDPWSHRRLEVFMETRRIALGPEWSEFQRCVMQMRGEIPRCEVEA